MEDLLEALAAGRITVAAARRALAGHGLDAIDEIALLDTHRDARTGLPEVVLAEGKSPTHVREIVATFLRGRSHIVISRLTPDTLTASRLHEIPDAEIEYDAEAHLAIARRVDHEPLPSVGRVAVITAGTADRAVAREATLTAQAAGVGTRSWIDRGVAAPARLAPTLREVLAWDPDIAIVAAGREGTLPTLLSALLPVPVIGLPVSTGYGHGGHGEAALATMLQSCSPLAVVNIDAGVTAGLLAARIARLAHERAPHARMDPPGRAEVSSPPSAPRPEIQGRQR